LVDIIALGDGDVGSQRVMDRIESDLCKDEVDDAVGRLKGLNDDVYNDATCSEFVKSMCVGAKSLICGDAGAGGDSVFGDDVDLNELTSDFDRRSLGVRTATQEDSRISETDEYIVIERLTIF
jgi:hypothetical protein